MCGIFGLVESEPRPDGIRAATAATETLRHRGPDDWGVVALVPQHLGAVGRVDAGDPRVKIYRSGGQHAVILSHRRLSVIDLTEAGRQPMCDPVSGLWITYNGEIYNYRELRDELKSLGVSFATVTDTEVVLQAYRLWGRRSLEKLRGMFAFGIWDARRDELFLARDRLGKKPLFFHVSPGRFAFASELKALLALPDWQPQISPGAIHDYLTFGYVPGRQTVFENAWKVPPGCFALWKNGRFQTEPYWDVETHFLAPATYKHEDDARDEVRELLSESVRMRLIGDVPVGAFLSGGLDSSAIVALMTQHLETPVKTFSIGFRESSFNELDHARTVARHLHTDHHEYVVEPQAAEILSDLVWWMDEPFADASFLPTFLLARLAREHVTVVLTGDGGDESFAGYDSYRAERWLNAYQQVPRLLRRALEASVRHSREGSSRTAFMRRVKRFVEKGRLPFERREWRMMFPEDQKRSLYCPEFAAAVAGRNSLDGRAEAFHTWRGLDPVTRLQLWDMMVYLPEDLMVKTDRATMAHGLESRCPLLDQVLVERSARMSPSLKMKGASTKHVLKRAVADLLPSSIVRRTKQGFSVPVSHWFRTDLRDFANDVLLSATSLDRGYFEPDAVKALLKAHESGRVDHGHKLWALVNLELWHQKFVDRAGIPPAFPLRVDAAR